MAQNLFVSQIFQKPRGVDPGNDNKNCDSLILTVKFEGRLGFLASKSILAFILKTHSICWCERFRASLAIASNVFGDTFSPPLGRTNTKVGQFAIKCMTPFNESNS
jgi:hypothetical protein